MPFVIDASIAGTWILPDERNTRADEALDRLTDDEAYVPTLFWFEVRNLLIISERRKRITADHTTEAINKLQTLPIRVDSQSESAATLQLARNYGLTVYDAAYLELAIRRGFPLLTLDGQMVDAAKAIGLALMT